MLEPMPEVEVLVEGPEPPNSGMAGGSCHPCRMACPSLLQFLWPQPWHPCPCPCLFSHAVMASCLAACAADAGPLSPRRTESVSATAWSLPPGHTYSCSPVPNCNWSRKWRSCPPKSCTNRTTIWLASSPSRAAGLQLVPEAARLSDVLVEL